VLKSVHTPKPKAHSVTLVLITTVVITKSHTTVNHIRVVVRHIIHRHIQHRTTKSTLLRNQQKRIKLPSGLAEVTRPIANQREAQNPKEEKDVKMNENEFMIWMMTTNFIIAVASLLAIWTSIKIRLLN
jgi:hypothetical protein